MNKILIVFGTRPELIKLAPIIGEFAKRELRDKLYIVNTNQHQSFLEQDIVDFNIEVDHKFNMIRSDYGLTELNGLLLIEFSELKTKLQNLDITLELIIGQGDTCTTFATAQFAFYEKIPFAHIESGLRTQDFDEPFPEEYYRKTIATLAALHFAPTLLAKTNLINEGIKSNTILVTGNTAIDNLRQFYSNREEKVVTKNLILITIHRRENIQNKLETIRNRIIQFVKANPEMLFIWLDNPGYKMDASIFENLTNLKMIAPISYFEMLELYQKTKLIITDSGGIQEEAAYLGLPTLLFRTKTERIEGIQEGISKYIDDLEIDLKTEIELLSKKQPTTFNPIYGNGYASEQIVDCILNNCKLTQYETSIQH